MQLKAGFFTSGIESLKTSEQMGSKVDALLEQLSYFDVDTNIEFSDTCDDPAVALIYNIVSRGAPTYASQFVEDILSTTIGKTLKRISENGEIYREIQKQEVRDLVFRALHIIDPRVKPFLPKQGNTKAQQIYHYILNGAVPSQGDYIWQLAETNRRYDDIFKFSKRFGRQVETLKTSPNYDFLSRKCDLCFSAPYSDNTADCVTYHFSNDRAGVDTTDYIVEDSVTTLLQSINVAGRVIVKDSDNPYDKTEELSYFTQSGYFDIVRDNYNSPLYNTEDGIEALQLALTPLAIARLQKIVLEALNTGTLSLEAKSWNICVIERDVPCAFLAFEDLRQQFTKFFALENQGRKFPTLKLEIFHTEEFANTELNLLYQGSRDDISEFNPLRRYDLLIDISVLRRQGFDSEVPPTITDRYFVVRSCKSPSAECRLLFSDSIHYDISLESDSDNDSDGDSDSDNDELDDDLHSYSEQEDALRYFLKNIFGKNDFIEGQVGTICKLLNGNNVLHISGPATGKTLIMLFVAMMKPGYSFVLPPTIAVMDSQFRSLRNRKIDCCYYISPVLQNSQSRALAVDDVVTGKSIITFISPSLIHDPYIRGVFRNIDERKIPIYYIMLDEAQRISLQTIEYRAYYQDIRNIIASKFSYENTMMLCLGAFTSALETNIQNEIAEKLQTDVVINNLDGNMMPNSNITIHDVDLRNAGNTDDMIAYSRRIKQQEISNLLQPMISKNSNSKAIVYSHNSPFDAQDIQGYPTMVCGVDTAHYIGDIDETYNFVSSSQAYNSMKELSRFCNDDIRILSATYTAGLGVHTSGVKRVIHMEPPLSLDSFCRANSRGDCNSNVQIDIFINIAPKDFAGEESVRDDRGNLTTVKNVVATNFDTANNLQRLKNLNPGAEKEKTILKEILDGIMFPQRTDRQNIIDAVYNEFNIEIDSDTEPMVNPYQLYIYNRDRSKSYGHIDFKAREFYMPDMQYDVKLAQKIQAYVWDIIADNTENPLAYLATMETEYEAEENDGIQTALDSILEGKKTEVIIPFYNNSFADAAEIVMKGLSLNINPLDIKRCYDRTISYEQFEKKLQREYNIRPRNLDDARKLEFKNVYSRFRNRKDTMRAVSRLKEIGIIDDYLVNTASGIVVVTLTKHSKDYYRMKLMPILQRNLTRERMLSYISNIEEEKFLCIEKYTNVLIDFFYSEIYPLYESAAMDSSKFFMTVLDRQKQDTITKELIAKNLNHYFKSRFKCSFVYSEQSSSDNVSVSDNIINIIDKAGSNINSLMNLQSSIDQTVPENRTAINKIIYGYCNLFTNRNGNAETRFEAYRHISNGLLDYRHKHTIEEFNEQTETIVNKIASENFDLKEETENVLTVQLQSQWLTWFNDNILRTQEVVDN